MEVCVQRTLMEGFVLRYSRVVDVMILGLGGDSKHFSSLPLPGEMIQFDLRIFFRWVIQPPSRCLRKFSDILPETNKAPENRPS